MGSLRILSASQQVAAHLRLDVLSGVWHGAMPGEDRLIRRLGVGRATVKAALCQLEDEGLLVPQGTGKPRLIVLPENYAPPALRIAILLYEPDDRKIDYLLDLLHKLAAAGHTAVFLSKTLTELGMDGRRVQKFVTATEADAWVVVGGSRPVLDWFAAQTLPAFALFGRSVSVPIASTSPKKAPAQITAVRRLVSMGHRRIVMLTRGERRKPVPGLLERTFLNELEAQGIPTGGYNLPDWDETPGGFHQLLDTLFRHTPPTALLVQGAQLTVAVLQHFTERGIKVPRDISLVCMDPDPAFAWCQPSISHLSWDFDPIVRRVVRWADNVARGKDDRRASTTLAEFIEGGTIGPAKR